MTHKWLYNEDFDLKDWYGFVYKITNNTNNKFYIGKKVFFFNHKHKLTKKQLAELSTPTRGRKKSHEIIQKESNWKEYWGSSKILLEDIKLLGENNFTCEILKLCKNKKQLTYWEMHYQCVCNCITNPKCCYNDSILGKFYPKDLIV